MIRFGYWLEEIGFVSRMQVKDFISSPVYGFNGFRRYNDGYLGAFGFICYRGKTRRLEVRFFSRKNYKRLKAA